MSIIMKNFLGFFIFWVGLLSGQSKENYTLIDAKMRLIPKSATTNSKDIADYISANFKSNNDRLRASFYWVASNISYDVANMETIDFTDNAEQKVAKTLQSRKGVCIHYAEVFDAIIKHLGFESRIIEGYTKQFGKISSLSHAWNIVKSDGKWLFIDPTWGAGTVDKKIFTKKLNNFYFKTPPTAMIATHMPYDYLWQLSNTPITNQSFRNGKADLNQKISPFDFISTIDNLKDKSEEIQLFEAIKRIEANGVISPLIETYWSSKKNELAGLRNNNAIEKLNAIVEESNAATAMFNDFIYYRNKHFKPMQSDETLLAMIMNPKEKVLACQKKLESLGPVSEANKSTVQAFRKNLSQLLLQIEDHEKFVKEYLSKSKLGRKAMFNRVTWFGVPLN